MKNAFRLEVRVFDPLNKLLVGHEDAHRATDFSYRRADGVQCRRKSPELAIILHEATREEDPKCTGHQGMSRPEMRDCGPTPEKGRLRPSPGACRDWRTAWKRQTASPATGQNLYAEVL
jgi:hypothetical protein